MITFNADLGIMSYFPFFLHSHDALAEEFSGKVGNVCDFSFSGTTGWHSCNTEVPGETVWKTRLWVFQIVNEVLVTNVI